MKFVSLINFTDQGFREIGQSPRRATAFVKQAKTAGVEVVQILWLTGRFDGLIVLEAPDPQTASAVMLQLSKAGNVKTETVQAFDSDEMQQLLSKLQG